MLPRVNRQRENNKVLQEQVTAATNKISDLEKKNDELNKSFDSALRTTLALRKSVSYLKIENRKVHEKNNSHSYIRSLKRQMLFLKNEKFELEEKIEVLSSQKLSFFENNKYTDTITVYGPQFQKCGK